MQQIYPPPSIKQIRKHGRWVRYIRPKVRYMTQYTIRPPSFIAFCGTQIITDYYFYKLRRFLRNEFGLNGVPIRIKMRSNMDINKFEDKYLDQLLQSKRKKKDKRRGRLRRLSLTEVLKLRKYRRQVKEFENAKDPERVQREDEYRRRADEVEEMENSNNKENMSGADERYQKYMNAMVERLEMSRQELKLKKQQNKKLTVDNFAKVERTKYRTYVPKQ